MIKIDLVNSQLKNDGGSYLRWTYDSLKRKFQEGFTKTHKEYIHSIYNVEGYKERVYKALIGELGNSFNKTKDEFYQIIDQNNPRNNRQNIEELSNELVQLIPFRL